MGFVLALVNNGQYACIAVLFLFGILFSTYAVYQIFFHPLAKYPGPFLAKFTDLYMAYHAWKGDIHIDMYNCHERYGDFVRYGPDCLNFNTATAVKDIYKDGKNFTKPWHYRILRHQAANMFTMINKQEHARRRRIIGPLVSDTTCRRFEDKILNNIKKCFSVLSEESEEWSKAKDMSQWFDYLSGDIMFEMIFGVKYNLLEIDTWRHVFKAIEYSNQRVGTILRYPLIGMFGYLDKLLHPMAIEARNQFVTFINRIVQDSMISKVEKNLFSILSSYKDPNTQKGFSMKEIVAETTNLCAASVETTSTAMSATFFYLSKNKRVYDKAAEEIRKTYSSIDEIQMDAKLSSCVYLRACIDEALRLAPPAPSSLFRDVPIEGGVVNGEFLPHGIKVGVPIYSIHHNTDYYAKPFEFKPERWLATETSIENIKKAQSAYCPFSHGSRSCIGKTLAITELMLTMAIALHSVDFRLDDNDKSNSFERPDEFLLKDHITANTNGPLINYRQRRF